MSTALTKADIIEAVYTENILTDKTRLEVKDVLEDLLALMKKAIVEDHSLLISGFGKFEAYEKNPRRGRNPQTDESITLDGRTVVVFRVSRKLRNELNGEE